MITGQIKLSNEMNTMADAVYRGYNAEDFERQYSPSLLVPNAEQLMQAAAENSASYRNRAGCRLDISYGATGRESLDVFPGKGKRCPVVLYIHGGYWRTRDKSYYSFVAEPLVNAGVTVVIPSYSHCPHVTVDQIVRQLRGACAWVWNNIDEYGGDRHNFYVVGNSTGGHLSAMLAATEWPEVIHEIPADLIKGAMSLSGLFDLEPLLLHSVNDTVNMDYAMARRNSPIHLKPTLGGPYISAVGGAESEEFIRQSSDFAQVWKEAGANIEFIEVAERNHFSIVGDMVGDDYVLWRRLKSMIGC